MERESTRGMGRGALLGPEESGLAHGTMGSGGSGLFLLGHGHIDVGWCGWWLGPALTRLLVGVFDGCVVSLESMLLPVSGGLGAGVPARILRTV